MGYPDNIKYQGQVIGLRVRGTIGKDKIYEVNAGNGYAGTVKGKHYQKKFDYVVPSSINNPQSEPYRTQLRAAVDKWKTGLTTAEKKEYNKRASKGLRMGGYHLFMREALTGRVNMYVDRGDPAAVDFAKADLTIDGSWNSLDLASIIPSMARAVLIETRVQSAAIGDKIQYRKINNANSKNTAAVYTLKANAENQLSSIIACDGNRSIEYNADNIVWSTLSLVIRGWWT